MPNIEQAIDQAADKFGIQDASIRDKLRASVKEAIQKVMEDGEVELQGRAWGVGQDVADQPDIRRVDLSTTVIDNKTNFQRLLTVGLDRESSESSVEISVDISDDALPYVLADDGE